MKTRERAIPERFTRTSFGANKGSSVCRYVLCYAGIRIISSGWINNRHDACALESRGRAVWTYLGQHAYISTAQFLRLYVSACACVSFSQGKRRAWRRNPIIRVIDVDVLSGCRPLRVSEDLWRKSRLQRVE